MSRIKNEKGYALLLVLLLIVFITILTAVFLRGSISNAKQEKIVDNNHLTVVAAETGYEKIRIDAYDKLVTQLERKVSIPSGYVNLTDTKSSYTFESNTDDPVLVVPIRKDFLIRIMGSVLGKDPASKNEKSLSFAQEFVVPSYAPSDSESQNGDSTNGNINKEWDSPMDLTVKDCGSSSSVSDQKKCKEIDPNKNKINDIDESSKVYFPNGYEYKRDSDFELQEALASFGKDFIMSNKEADLDVQGAQLYVNGKLDIQGDFETQDDDDINSLVQVRDDIIVGGSADIQNSNLSVGNDFHSKKEIEVQGSDIRVGRDMKSDKDLSIQKNDGKRSNIQVMGNVISLRDIDIQKSDVTIGEDLVFYKEAEFQNSKININGKLISNSSEEDFEIESDSKVCVLGNVDIKGTLKIEKGSKLLSSGKITIIKNTEGSGVVKELSQEEFKLICPFPGFDFSKPGDNSTGISQPNSPVSWPEPSLKVDYNVKEK